MNPMPLFDKMFYSFAFATLAFVLFEMASAILR